MKRVIILAIVACILLEGVAHMETVDMSRSQSYDELSELLGNPIQHFNSIMIWVTDDGLFVGAFSNSSNTLVLSDYAVFDSNYVCLEGPIEEKDTVDNILSELKSETSRNLNQVYDIGSGIYIWAKISYDGYIVMWDGESTWLCDCINQYELSVLKFRLKKLF